MTVGGVEKAEEFAAQLRRVVSEWEEELIPTVSRAVALQGLRGLVLVTPVDTGYARSGWQVSFNSASTAQPAEGASDKTGSATLKAGEAAIAGSDTFPHIFISNNVPYIEVLDEGRWAGESIGEGEFAFGAGVNGTARRTGARGSIQAPQGILQPVFDELVTAIQTEETRL